MRTTNSELYTDWQETISRELQDWEDMGSELDSSWEGGGLKRESRIRGGTIYLHKFHHGNTVNKYILYSLHVKLIYCNQLQRQLRLGLNSVSALSNSSILLCFLFILLFAHNQRAEYIQCIFAVKVAVVLAWILSMNKPMIGIEPCVQSNLDRFQLIISVYLFVV